jgi:hypothetical protein
MNDTLPQAPNTDSGNTEQADEWLFIWSDGTAVPYPKNETEPTKNSSRVSRNGTFYRVFHSSDRPIEWVDTAVDNYLSKQ